MEFNLNQNKPIVVLLGSGSMGTAIVKRIASGKKILLGDISRTKLDEVSKELAYAGYEVDTKIVDASSKESLHEFAQYAASLGDVKYYVHTAGASPNQSKYDHIVNLDLIGTSYALDEFGEVMAPGGAGLVISSQTGYMMRLSDEDEKALAFTPSEELKDLDIVKSIHGSGTAYCISKRANHLRVRTMAATIWGDHGARINSISPGIIVTPLAYDEFKAAGAGYQKMIEASPAKRVGNSDEIAEAAAFLLSEKASFITGTDLLVDGGVIAAINAGRYQLHLSK